MSDGKDPAFLFYSNAFYTGTRLMTPEERACYIDLLIYQHQNGIIPLDIDRVLMFCSGVAKATLQATLKAKFKQCDKGWYNEKLKNVMELRGKYKEHQSDSGVIGAFYKRAKADLPAKKYRELKDFIYNEYGKERLLNDIKSQATLQATPQATLQATLKGLLKHLENENENENVNVNVNKDVIENDYEILEYPSFDDFWELYDKKVDKVATEKKWGKLTQEEKEQAIDYIPQYKLSEPDKTFRKNPLTFINNKSWNNEIITKARSGNDAKIPLASSFTPEDFGM
jgi:hypothetical protein